MSPSNSSTLDSAGKKMWGGKWRFLLVTFFAAHLFTGTALAADLDIARDWKPGTLKDDGKRGGTEKGFRK